MENRNPNDIYRAKNLIRYGAASVLVGVLGAGSYFGLQAYEHHTLTKRLADAFPRTKITSIDCNSEVNGLCEVVAGTNVFYSSKDGRYIVVGSLLDLQKKVDLTDQRLKQLASLDAATAKINGLAGGAPSPSQAAQVAQAQPPALPTNIKIDLPVTNAVIHNPGAPIKISVFSDFNCHFCKSLFEELTANKDIEVTEYPIGIIKADSITKAQIVLCSKDRVQASDAAYNDGQIRTVGDCGAAMAAAQANTKFARDHNISGTPTIVRADGTVSAGYLPPEQLKAFASSKS